MPYALFHHRSIKRKFWVFLAAAGNVFIVLFVLLSTLRQNQILLTSAAVSCPTLPNEAPQPLQQTVASDAENTIYQIEPEIMKEQRQYAITYQDIRQLSDNFTKRKQQLKKLMRHDPEKALAIMNKAVLQEQPLKQTNCTELPVQLEGNLAAYAVDYANGTSSVEYLLQTQEQTVQLHVTKVNRTRLQSGMRLRVSGYKLDGAMLLDGNNQNSISILSDAPQFAAAITTKKAAIQMGNFTTTNASTPTVTTVMTDTFPAVSQYYEQISQGKFSFAGTVLGWKNIGIPPTCDITTGVNAGLQAASTQLDWANTSYFLLAAPFEGCAWEGISTIGLQRISTPSGTKSMGLGLVRVKNGTLSAGVTAHEFGHQLGWYHAGFADCGSRVLSGTCSVIVYGDMYDIMGNAIYMGTPNAYHLEMLNWLDTATLRTVSGSGTFSLLPLSSTQSGLKVLKIPQTDPNNTFYIEYRQPTGADANLAQISGTNVFEGVLIHRRYSDLSSNAPDTILIDPSPPSDAKTAALLPNTPFTIPGTTVTVTNLGKTGIGVNVQITFGAVTTGPTIQPTEPGSGTRVGLTVAFHGIGNGGDNVAPQTSGTQSPVHPQRTVTVAVYDSANQQVVSKQGMVLYNGTNGNFQGVVELGNLASNIYIIKVGSIQYLTKVLPGIQQITAGAINSLPPVALVTGDINNDNLLSVSDYNLLLDCFSDLTQPRNCNDQNKKLAADITDDGNVNQFDYNLFLREMSVQSGQ